MEPESSLFHSHVPATCPYPEPAGSIPPQPTSWRSILILSFHLRLAVNRDSNSDRVSHLAATPSTTISDTD